MANTHKLKHIKVIVMTFREPSPSLHPAIGLSEVREGRWGGGAEWGRTTSALGALLAALEQAMS